MARFSVGGDEDGNEEGSRNNDRPFPKRPRTAGPIVYKRANGSSSSPAERAVVYNPANLSSYSTTQPEEPAPVEEVSEGESEEESDESFSDTSEESETEDDDEFEEEDQQNQPVEARVNPAADVNVITRVEPEEGGDAPAALSFTLTDTDVLDCPICLEPLSSPVYQCENGHIACSNCCIKMSNKCASCFWPIGYNRCRAIEKVLESVRVSCRNVQHGCPASLIYCKKFDHEKICTYTPCSCPYTGCNYVGSDKSLYLHFKTEHPRCAKLFRFNYTVPITFNSDQKHVFLQDRHDNTLFVLSRSIELFGNCVNLTCIGAPSLHRQFRCDLNTRYGVSSMQLKTVADTTPKWVVGQRPKEKYLVVPKEFFTSLAGSLNVEITIWKDVNRQ